MFKRFKHQPVDEQESVRYALPVSPEARPHHRAVYEVGDFTGLDADQVTDLLARAENDAAYGLPGCAHLVVTCDLWTGLVNHHVPCSTGLEALGLAAAIVAEKRTEDPERPFTVTVTPLLPH